MGRPRPPLSDRPLGPQSGDAPLPWPRPVAPAVTREVGVAIGVPRLCPLLNARLAGTWARLWLVSSGRPLLKVRPSVVSRLESRSQ